MRQIIEGKKYDTETATEICDVSPIGYSRQDFQWEDTRLYVTSKGRFFLAGKGGPKSRWATALGNSISSGSGIKPLSLEEAQWFAERHADSAVVAKYFEVEDA
jgi:hypothetical protein